ncbi:MAG: DUF1002 domain-containing protein [Sarcina sp.]
MSVKRGITSIALCGVLFFGGSVSVLADGANVVTLGTDLSDDQKQTVLKYFGVKENEVVVLEVNNDEERKYLEGVASEAQLGKKTFSCSYVEPTTKGSGIKVKTVNLTYVTSNMIASTLATCGITDANVIAMSPMPVSGTGALTGVMKAFEDATGEKLDEEKKEIASEELVITGDIAGEVGPDKATGIVNDIKTEIIKENTKDTVQIAETIINVTNNYNVTLTEQQQKDLESLMKKVADQEYDYSQIKDTLKEIGQTVEDKLSVMGESIDKGTWQNIKDTVSGWFESIGDWFSGIFNDMEEDLGILGQTNDNLLGDDVVVDATDENAIATGGKDIATEAKGFFEKIWDWFKGLFSSENKTTDTNTENTTEENETGTDENEENSDQGIIGGSETPDTENDKESEETTDPNQPTSNDGTENKDDTENVENSNTDNTNANEGQGDAQEPEVQN